ncbi:MAG: PSD1 and planctomycete cytochrome C domain-containing protein [Pirellulaceae bacterium]|nr:PSD1 and planctomycete cytochrome C domain-containing protein [Pirellulaceae bacterium]
MHSPTRHASRVFGDRSLKTSSVLVVAFGAIALSLKCVAAEPAADDYAAKVKPVLKARCFACHGALKQESGLRLDTAKLIRQGGDSGSAIDSTNVDKSLLITRAMASDKSERMPPEGAPLTGQQIDDLRRWIAAGAAGPEREQAEQAPRDHWAFQLPVRPSPLPPGGHPVDALLDEQRRRHNIKTQAPVDRRLLLRRIYIDLIGVPPTPSQVAAFLADRHPDAVERVVDQLLADPRYGERWGRHWMDVWRYTDWFGLGKQLRNSQKHIWHWRDWIIESLNDDAGYDRMVADMLAADEISPTDRERLRATGFLARNYYLFNRTTWLDETIEHTSKALLGLTINCAKCHDHKYDPISQVDYYQLRAIFEPHQVRLDPAPGATDLEQNGLPRVFDAHPDATTYLHIRGNPQAPDKSQPISPAVPEVLRFGEWNPQEINLPPAAHLPSLQPFVLEDHLQKATAEIANGERAVKVAGEALANAARTKVVDQTAGKAEPASGDAFIVDHFDKPLEVWKIGPGKWSFENGVAVQSAVMASRSKLASTKNHPADFIAKLKFQTTGGQMWKSVGVAFDVADGREKMVYMSAVQPGSKVQVSYKDGAGQQYPLAANLGRPVKLNETYELQIAVRGPLVNVAIDGKHQLAYRLPLKREPGKLELITYDATAEFDEFTARALPTSHAMVEANSNSKPVATVAAARSAVALAEAKLRRVKLRPAVLQTAHAADAARFGGAAAEEVDELIGQAAIAARRYELAEAEEKLVAAKAELAASTDKTRKAAQTKSAAAEKTLEMARAKLKEPGRSYTTLRVALKALEGPAESDADRRKPFPTKSTGRRAAFARWVVDPRNPLTARVAVNHMWTRHFGQPLVAAMTDFGRRTASPPQHRLLDWLAVEFMESGWSMKHLHRVIMTSQAYRLGSSTLGADADTVEADAENQFYWRRRPMRMESQVVRDSLLHLSNSLSSQIGGPTISPKQQPLTSRRSLYFTHSRDDEDAFLVMFDNADIFRCYRRQESIVPQQALTLFNSKLSMTMARRLAERLEQHSPGLADRQFATLAFEWALCTLPSDEELDACVAALRETAELLKERPADEVKRRARQNLVHALLNHNDFLTIR